MTENTSNNMVFFASIKDSIDALDLSYKLKVEYYEGVINYGLYGITPNFSKPSLTAIFIAIKPNIDANNRKKQQAIKCSENGKKGGGQKGNTNACKSKSKNTKTSKKTSPKTSIDVDVDVDVDADVDADVDVDAEKETKDISFISSSSSKEKKEKADKEIFLLDNDGNEVPMEQNHDDTLRGEMSANTKKSAAVEKTASAKTPLSADKSSSSEKTASVGKTPSVRSQSTLHERDVAFYNTIIPYISQYGSEAIQTFYDYWTEPNAAGTRLRYEMEKTWNLNYRLERWMAQRRRLNLQG